MSAARQKWTLRGHLVGFWNGQALARYRDLAISHFVELFPALVVHCLAKVELG